VSAGTGFPHPRNPAGRFPAKDVVRTYDTILSSGSHTLRNYLVFRTWPLSKAFRWWWERPSRKLGIEGINLPYARKVKEAVSIPVLCTGGFQTASTIAAAIDRGDCDAVTLARTALANPDIVQLFAEGHDRPPRPCTYCNKCLFNFIENPLGCYDETRFASHEEMVRTILSVYDVPSFARASTEVHA
jgi:2,4-dienoyl-CoA reductase (NADPH2)